MEIREELMEQEMDTEMVVQEEGIMVGYVRQGREK